ncbi:MAG: MurT ligase domain-containing protein [Chloroflexota bacterium]
MWASAMALRAGRRVRVRRMLAVNAGKTTAAGSRALRRGGGTALPGLVAERLDSRIVADLARQLALGSVAVSGTNGKTTTCRLLAAILKDQGLRTVRNESGSNLMRGVITSLLHDAGILGNLPRDKVSIGVFEIDEAALLGVLPMLEPRCLLLLNLFRDQLDRYGEVATVANLWKSALQDLPAESALIVNADDPLVWATARSSGRRVVSFGLDMPPEGVTSPEHGGDVKACPCCGAPIAYRSTTFGHLGDYACTVCNFARVSPDVSVSGIELLGTSGSRFLVRTANTVVRVRLPLPGMYNLYNAAAAITTALVLGVPEEESAASLEYVTPAFGRMERFDAEGRTVCLALAKNPAGLNEVLRTATNVADLHLLMMLSDNTADGHDVSWIWDADVEMLADHVSSAVFAGTRGPDMALRFKYAGIIGGGDRPAWEVRENSAQAFDVALAGASAGSTLFVVPTYTALLDIRSILVARGYVRPYWDE